MSLPTRDTSSTGHRPGHCNNLRYHDHRFPPISLAELQRRIDRLGALSGRFQEVRIQQVSRHIYRIEREDISTEN